MFQNRSDAGRQLAEKLKNYQAEEPIILALPRGGVPVGYEVSQALKAPLDIFIVRKVGPPWNPELGVGAVAPGVKILDENSLRMLRISASQIQEIIEREQQEVKRRQRLYCGNEDVPKVTGKTVILVDDGIATGVTIKAAIEALKHLKAAKVILAVPVGPYDIIMALRAVVDDLICLETPYDFYAVSSFYRNFPQVSDEEVISFLQKVSYRKRGSQEI